MIEYKYVLILISYIIGSVPSALWLGKIFKGIDIRNFGSGNSGTTNAFRVLGPALGFPVLFLDIFKGMAIILFINIYNIDISGISIVIYGIVAAIGHAYPIFAKFKGGKSVATGAGMAFALTPIIMSIIFLIFVSLTFITGYVSLSVTISVIILLILSYIMNVSIDIKIIYILISLFIFYKHKRNYIRLLQGTENSIKKKKKK